MADRVDEADAAPAVRTLGPPLPEPFFESLINPLARRFLASQFYGLASGDLLVVRIEVDGDAT